MLRSARDAVRETLGDDQGDDKEIQRADSRALCGKPAEDMVQHFHDLQSTHRRGSTTLQSIRDLCTKFVVNEPDTQANAKTWLKTEFRPFQKLLSSVISLLRQRMLEWLMKKVLNGNVPPIKIIATHLVPKEY